MGKAFALISCAEPVSSLVGSIIFNSVYRATVDKVFPGFVFALEAGFFVLLFVALVGLWFDIRQHAGGPFNALKEETQLRSQFALTDTESKSDLKSAHALTDVMNHVSQQHGYGTTTNKSSAITSAAPSHNNPVVWNGVQPRPTVSAEPFHSVDANGRRRSGHGRRCSVEMEAP